MGPGVHEWYFKFTLRGSLPESVEGLAGSYIVYNLHATMDRGMMAKTLYADKHLRIVRTLASEILSDAAMEQVSQPKWLLEIGSHERFHFQFDHPWPGYVDLSF